MPTNATTLLQNGFLHARNWIRSWLEDEIGRVLAATSPRATDPGDTPDDCVGIQAELGEQLDWIGIPGALQPLAPWAARLGAGDDVCRPLLFATLSPVEKSELEEIVGECGAAANRWLDEFGSQPMTAEAAALMYLLLGIEEM